MPNSIETITQELADLLAYSSPDKKQRFALEIPDSGRFSSTSLRTDRFHQFELLAPPWRALAVDASLKSILDCGAFLVVLLKAAFEVWQLGSRRVREGIETHIQIVSSLESARQKMAKLEFEIAERAARYLGEDDIALLDRPLCLRSKSSPGMKQALQTLSSSLERQRAKLLGVCKSSRLGVEGGAPIIGYLLHHAFLNGFSARWFYHPLVDAANASTFRIGQPCVACLDPSEDFAFRIDLGSTEFELYDAQRVLGSLSALGDRFAYGYPYPLRSVHEACSISRTEVDICRQRLLEEAERRGIASNLKYALKATSFRGEVLLS